MLVNEIFKSIQGESSFAGQICSFVRLSGCNLRCTWCDTQYAFTEGTQMDIREILDTVAGHGTQLAEITGGEPLLQAQTPELCNELLSQGYRVLVETNGSQDISVLPSMCIRIVDVKCPDSGSGDSFLARNLNSLTILDECKFVIGSRNDFDWSIEFLRAHSLNNRCAVHFSPAAARIEPSVLAQWILEVNAPVRLSLQMHKIIWGEKRGV